MKLTFLKGKHAGESPEFNPPGVFIGRESDNDLQLPEDGVSQYHAKIMFEEDKWILYDLGSSNGTKLNGKLINKPTELTPKDLIYFAQEAFRFECDGKEKSPVAKKVKTEEDDDCFRIRSPEESKPKPKPEMTETNKFPKEKKSSDNPLAKTKKKTSEAALMRRLVDEAVKEKKRRLRRIIIIIAVCINAIILALWIKHML